jgi:hypothetical protein
MNAVCQTCGRLSPPGAQTCQYCGASLPSTPVYQDPFRARPQRPSSADPWGEQGYAQPIHGLKDPNTGLVLEVLPGLFGLLGIGHIWAGEVAIGVGLLLGYWVAWTFLALLTLVTFGLFLCFFPVYLLMWPGVPIISAIMLQRRLQRQQQQLVHASTTPYPY